MKMQRTAWFLLLACMAGGPALSRDLSLGERISAQVAIDRAYRSHMIGASGSLEGPAAYEAARRKVETTLQQSIALAEVWNHPITAEALDHELDRILRNGRFPERLVEIYHALGDDPVLLKETLVRASLAERLFTRYLSDEPEPDPGGNDLRPQDIATVARERDGERAALRNGRPPDASLTAAGGQTSAECLPDGAWDPSTILHTAPEPALDQVAHWTGTLVLTWGGDHGGRYDPLTDDWTDIYRPGQPSVRYDFASVWTGSELIVWGGAASSPVDDGARYDPQSNTWTPLPSLNAPSPRYEHSAVWTGTEMIIWGGRNTVGALATGARYNPSTNAWTSMSLIAAPVARSLHSAVWTGAEMIVAGGRDNFNLSSGARYVPSSDQWTPIPDAPVGFSGFPAVWTGSQMLTHVNIGGGSGLAYSPAGNNWSILPVAPVPNRFDPGVTWTGTEMVVWGGFIYMDIPGPPFVIPVYQRNGAAFNPSLGTWRSITTAGAPTARKKPALAWAGQDLVVWGGETGAGPSTGGGRYNPSTDSWLPVSNPFHPLRYEYSTAWTGTEMILWGGTINSQASNSGDRYDPLLDSWKTTSTSGAPAPRGAATAVWTGTRMIVWGGADSAGTRNDGGRYDPVADAWSSVSTIGAPAARAYHSAIWTGTRMVVWGGGFGPASSNSGGRYDPATDSWLPTSTTGAPPGRLGHVAAWTGNLMVVWGGYDQGISMGSGGRYDPMTDKWRSISVIGAPTARHFTRSVWTGTRFVVWGGYTFPGSSYQRTGGMYDPVADSWTATSLAGAPSPRGFHNMAWTGTRTIVWAGTTSASSVANDGGIFDPVSNTWTALGSTGAPEPRGGATSVWTGSFLLIWGGGAGNATLFSGGRMGFGHGIDGDADGRTECLGDCDDTDPTVTGLPGEITGLTWTTENNFVWNSAIPGSGSATVHDVVRGLAPQLPVGSGSEICLVPGTGVASAADNALPAPGSAFFYLVRGRNRCGKGTYGFASAGSERLTSACP